MREIRIARQRPRFLFESRVPEAWAAHLEKPVALDGAALFAAGWNGAPRKPGRDPILIAIDASSGNERFRVERVHGGDELYTSLPTVRERGEIWIAVYSKDAWLKLLSIDRDGRAIDEAAVGASDEERRDLRIAAGDLSSKLWLAPIAECGPAGDGMLVSWLYRQVRYFHSEHRTAMGARPRWSAPEWMLAAVGEVMIGATPPGAGERLVGRNVAGGEELWSMSARHLVLGAVREDELLLADRGPRAADHDRRADAWLDHVAADESAIDPDLGIKGIDSSLAGFHREHPLTAATLLRSLSTRDGRETWSRELPGDIVSMQSGGGVVSIVTAREDQTGELVHLDRGGALLGRHTIHGEPTEGFGWPPPPNGWPRLCALDGELVLLASRTHLRCESLSGREVWRIPLPGPCLGFRPRMADRILSDTNITLAQDRLYLRDGTNVWVYEVE